MTTAHRTMTAAARAALAFLASAGILFAVKASAQPADPSADQQQPDTSATAQPAAQPTPSPTPPQLPPPPPAYPRSYPFTFQPKPQPTEPQGPTTSWEPLRFAVAFEHRTSWLLDDGAKRLVGQKRPAGAGASLQADVLRPQEDLAVRLDLAWVSTSNSTYQGGSSLAEELKTNLFSLGVALRYHVRRWLAPFARVAGGLGWDKLTVADLHDRQRFTHGAVGAGVFLRSPALRLRQGTYLAHLGLVGSVEAGYAVASGSDFVLHADVPSVSEKPIPISEVHLGHEGRSAPYVRISVGLAF
jgi:hypothetical protein